MVVLLGFGGTAGLSGQERVQSKIDRARRIPCCDFSEVAGVVWYGNRSEMTLQELASYCAPILWFSPDEPLLNKAKGTDILIPEPFPFEDSATAPVVYYRVRTVLQRSPAGGEAYRPLPADRNNSVINLRETGAIDLDYFFYYHEEAGLGRHTHDVESAEFKVAVWRRDECPDCRYALLVQKVIGKAHGVLWYDNTLEVDRLAKFPMTILVEEGKHASCTDKNGDGYYTPGFDVNRRPNDAWGVRDILASGQLSAGGFNSWFAKVRTKEHRVFPPLPQDSPLRGPFLKDGSYAAEAAVYGLRPFPSPKQAQPDLVPFIADKGDPDWPRVEKDTDVEKFSRWIEGDSFTRSLAIAYRFDGGSGLSFSFPLLIVKNFEDPLAGGFLVNRLYLKGGSTSEFGWLLHYTTSASRWIDGYFAAGAGRVVVKTSSEGQTLESTDVNFVFETGVKFRFGLSRSPLKFLTRLTDFWGVRFGIKSVGAFKIDQMRYVVEIGAGTW